MRKRILQISAAMCMVLFAVCALPMRVYAARAYDQQTVLDIATNGMGNYQECGPFTVEINGKKDWKNLCLGFVNSCFNKAYGIVAGNEEACCAYHYGSLYIDSTSRDNIPIGADVFLMEARFGAEGVTILPGILASMWVMALWFIHGIITEIHLAFLFLQLII